MSFKVKLVSTKKIELPDGEVIEVREPSCDEFLDFHDKVKEADGNVKAQLAVSKELLEGLGFPGDLLSKMSIAGMSELIEYIADQKKS